MAGKQVESDEDRLLSDEPSIRVVSVASPFKRYHRSIAAAVGSVALVACAVFALNTASTQGQKMLEDSEQFTLRSLLEDADMHKVASHNIEETMSRMSKHKPTLNIHGVVKDTFAKTSQHLSQENPEIMQMLETTKITKEQKDGYIHAMRYLGDREVQALGLQVARAVRESGSSDPLVLQQILRTKLGPHLDRLAKKVFSPPMHSILAGGGMEHLLTPSRIAQMKKTHKSWDSQMALPRTTARRLLAPATPVPVAAAPAVWGAPALAAGVIPGSTTTSFKPSESLIKAEQGVGIAGAAVTEAAVLLRMMRPLSKMFHNDLNINPWVTTGVGAGATALEVASCEINAAADNFNPEEVVSCPMEFGSEAMDALRAAFTLSGVLGDNDPTNGVQGNHNNNAKVHTGIFNDEEVSRS